MIDIYGKEVKNLKWKDEDKTKWTIDKEEVNWWHILYIAGRVYHYGLYCTVSPGLGAIAGHGNRWSSEQDEQERQA